MLRTEKVAESEPVTTLLDHIWIQTLLQSDHTSACFPVRPEMEQKKTYSEVDLRAKHLVKMWKLWMVKKQIKRIGCDTSFTEALGPLARKICVKIFWKCKRVPDVLSWFLERDWPFLCESHNPSSFSVRLVFWMYKDGHETYMRQDQPPALMMPVERRDKRQTCLKWIVRLRVLRRVTNAFFFGMVIKGGKEQFPALSKNLILIRHYKVHSISWCSNILIMVSKKLPNHRWIRCTYFRDKQLL